MTAAAYRHQGQFYIGRGVIADFRRRWPYAKSDFLDGKKRSVRKPTFERQFSGVRTSRDIQKTISSAIFLYVTILPTQVARSFAIQTRSPIVCSIVALGMLNDQNTREKIGKFLSRKVGVNVRKHVLRRQETIAIGLGERRRRRVLRSARSSFVCRSAAFGSSRAVASFFSL